MEYTVRKISNDLYQINLVHQSPDDLAIIKNSSREYLEFYYHNAVSKKLGSNASLLSIENDELYPFSIIGRVKFARGIGNI